MARILLSVVIFCLISLLTMAWDFNHNLNVPRKHSVVQRSANINYTNVLNFWKQHKKELVLHGEHKEVVLVMGNTGAGKTTLISALIGRKLRSTMSNGYRTIVDEEGRIGTGLSSKTLIPEVMTDRKRNVIYVDCSGFRDNRNVEYEISSIYFQNILMNQVERIKFIFVINYDSLKNNGNKNDFDDLFEHIGEFIKDISKFHDGIALVATKVENTYEVSGDGTVVLVNDNETVLRGIADFLKNKKEIYRSKTNDPEKYKTFMDLIDVLLQKRNGLYTRIAIFRQTIGQGLLENLPKTRNEINAIAKMTTENLLYIEKKMGDFGFALSKSAKNTVDQIVDDIFRNALANRLHKIGYETLMYYSQVEKQYNDIGILRERVSSAYDVISRIKNVDEPQKLFEESLNVANTLSIPVSLTNLNIISDDIKTLKFFTTVSNSYKDTHMMLLKNKMQNVTESIENLKNFYDFLNNLQMNLATYESQKLKNDKRILNIMTSCTGSKYKTVQNIMDLENIVNEIGSDYIFQKVKILELNQFQLKHLKAVFVAFSSKLTYSCALLSKRMIVKGYNVKMSSVVKIDCWAQAKNILVFSLNKVFMDCTVNKTGAESQLFIFAPKWEVIGGPKIILDGKTEKSHRSASAKTAISNVENGMDGLPGLPGGPAGNFFGVGRQFTYLEHLEIHANGGNGGPGQHGGNGADGIKGEELPESFFEILFVTDEYAQSIVNYFKVIDFWYNISTNTKTYVHSKRHEHTVIVHGKSAEIPSDGGNGGAGGSGGYPGRIVMNGLGKSVNVKVSNNSGRTGLVGQGGQGGKNTSDGRSVKFMYFYDTGLVTIVTSPPHYSDIKWTDGAKVPAGKDGNPGSNNYNKKYPSTTSMASLYPAINSFKDFVRMNQLENIKESELRIFIRELENNRQIKAQYDTLAFVKEFEGLEKQFLGLRNEIDFMPFYDSFLVRVEEFAKFEKILENKKVLSYIYTAALTKVFTLKKERKGKTVVNLSKYLNTIETRIKEIREAQHLQIVRNYRNDYENTLRNKIQEANDFIENKIELEINRFWEESEGQVKVIIDEIEENKNATSDAIASLEKNKAKIRDAMELRSIIVPLKLAAAGLSFIGSVGAGVGVAVAGSISIAEGMLLDMIRDQEQNKIYSVDPNLKSMSQVTEVYNKKPQQLVNKLTVVVAKLDKYKDELSTTQKDRITFTQKVDDLKKRVHEVKYRTVHTISDVDRRQMDAKHIEKQINEFINTQKYILEQEKQLANMKTDTKNTEQLRKEKVLRRIDEVQSVLNSAEIVFDFVKELDNDKGMIKNINNQISDYAQQLKDMEKMEGQVYNIMLPDLRQIENTVHMIRTSLSGSSRVKLDLSKWTVRSTLRDVKSLLQKFTYKMSFELQSNLKRSMEKIDEGFSILIDIYDRIDSYSDSVKQAEYMAHIVSTPMMNVQVTDSKLSGAMIDLKFIIQSNILFEQYGIALYAFKQHFYPFAAHILQKFELPIGMQFNDIETLRSHIIEKIKDMKNHIDESEATIGEYSKYIHEKSVFNSDTTGSSPFYVWKHDTIRDEVQQLFNGSEILLKADISKGVYSNAVKYSDIGINFKLKNNTLQNNLISVLKNFKLTMTMVGNNYYRCGERYYFISFDDDITISYTLKQDEGQNWIDPNLVYTTVRDSHTFLSPYVMWSIKLERINKSVSFDDFNNYVNETIDMELIGQGCYIEQNSDFNFDVCNEYLETFYNIENIAKELV